MYKVSSKSDTGIKRDINEDAIKVAIDNKLFIVADGMGGHLAGEIASKKTVDIIENYFKDHFEEPIQDRIINAINTANKLVYEKSIDNKELNGMGTTCSLAFIEDGKVHIGHVGDSRIYFITDHYIKQITNDHTLVKKLVESGEITEEEAETHPKRHYITRAVGTEEYIEVDYNSYELNMDYILICSDGLTEELQNVEIFNIIKNNDINDISDKLVNSANEGGGVDNISVIVIYCGRQK